MWEKIHELCNSAIVLAGSRQEPPVQSRDRYTSKIIGLFVNIFSKIQILSEKLRPNIPYYMGKYTNDVIFWGVIFSRILSDFRQKCSWLQLYFCAVQSVYHYIRPSGYMPYAHFSFFWCNSKLCIPGVINTNESLFFLLMCFCNFVKVSYFLKVNSSFCTL